MGKSKIEFLNPKPGFLRSFTKQVNLNHSDHGPSKEPKNPIWTRMLVHHDPSDLGLICL